MQERGNKKRKRIEAEDEDDRKGRQHRQTTQESTAQSTEHRTTFHDFEDSHMRQRGNAIGDFQAGNA
jgi:hypothetical protein